jgi:hypothetical protein
MQAVTVFPIAFAAVVGRMVTKLAAWKLERGSKVRSLEQLIGSRTVFSTVTTRVSLRSLNVLGSALALLWALSPLGGQSALRVIDTGFKTLHSNSSVLYFDTGAKSDFAEWFDGSNAGVDATSTALALLNSMYTAPLLSSSIPLLVPVTARFRVDRCTPSARSPVLIAHWRPRLRHPEW